MCLSRVLDSEINAVSALEKKAEATKQSKRSTRYRMLASSTAETLPFYRFSDFVKNDSLPSSYHWPYPLSKFLVLGAALSKSPLLPFFAHYAV
jgi:hypothetical protein